MGVFKPFSSCNHGDTCDQPDMLWQQDKTQNPNPDPHNFVIKRVLEKGRFTLLLVEYPDCTNYEGRKIMVFEDLDPYKLLNTSRLDPHFCDSPKHKSPVARFEPTNKGWDLACKFCEIA